MIKLTADDSKEKKGKEIPIGDRVFEMLAAKHKVVRIGESMEQGAPVFPNGRGEKGKLTRHFSSGLKTPHKEAGLAGGGNAIGQLDAYRASVR